MEMAGDKQIFVMEKAEQSKIRQRFFAMATAVGTWVTVGSFFYSSHPDKSSAFIAGGIFFGMVAFLGRKKRQAMSADRKLIISKDGLELLKEQYTQKIAFAEITSGELWIDHRNQLLNISCIGSENRMDISGFENMTGIIEQVKRKTSAMWQEKREWWFLLYQNPFFFYLTLAAVPSVIMIVFYFLSYSPRTAVLDRRLVRSLISIALGLYLLLSNPYSNYRLGKTTRLIEMISGIYFLLSGFMFFFNS